ncbi:unnamed protein product, partial [Mesorhabditis spiculigera]
KLAVKCEKYSRSMLHVEVNVLLHAAEQKCKHFCERVAHGSVGKEYVFIVMTLLGRDLHKARNEMKDRRFTLSTALRIGVHTLKGIEELHRLGFLSRDIKPGNFAPGLRENKQNKLIFLYDFGLARKYLDSNGNIVQPRPDVGWRGTTRYGSLTAHHRADLSRRDDLESWFYMLVEFTNGQLPWRTITDRGAVLLSKQAARTPIGLPTFLVNCPKQFPVLLKYIDELVFTSAPDYAHLLKILDEAREENNVKAYERWDWEDESLSSNSISQASSHSEREQKAKPEASPREVRNKKKFHLRFAGTDFRRCRMAGEDTHCAPRYNGYKADACLDGPWKMVFPLPRILSLQRMSSSFRCRLLIITCIAFCVGAEISHDEFPAAREKRSGKDAVVVLKTIYLHSPVSQAWMANSVRQRVNKLGGGGAFVRGFNMRGFFAAEIIVRNGEYACDSIQSYARNAARAREVQAVFFRCGRAKPVQYKRG